MAGRSIRATMGLIFVVLMWAGALSVRTSLQVAQAQQHDALVLNLAGRQRMLSQKMAQEVWLAVLADQANPHRPQADDTARPGPAEAGKPGVKAACGEEMPQTPRCSFQSSAREFEESLRVLLNGGPVVYANTTVVVPPARDPAFRAALEQVQTTWASLYQAAQVVLTSEPWSPAFTQGMADLERLSDLVLAQMDRAVRIYQGVAETRVARLKWIQLAFLFTGAAVLALGYGLIQLQVLRPIRALETAARRMEEGDLETPIEVKTRNELRRLARSFDSMRAQVKARIRAAEEAEARYHSLFDGVPIGLYRTTPAGRIIDANPALVQMLGYPDRQSLLQVNARHLFVDREAHERKQALLAATGVLRNFETRYRRFDGTCIWVQDNARVVRDARGQPLYYEGSLQDITSRRQAQAELEARVRELSALRQISTALRGATTVQEMAPLLATEAARLVQAEVAFTCLLDRTRRRIITQGVAGVSTDIVGQEQGLEEGIIGQVIRTGAVYRSTNLTSDPLVTHGDVMTRLGPGVCVPLRTTEGQVVGALLVARRREAGVEAVPFQRQEERLLITLAEIAGNALQRAGIMETLEQRVVQRTRELKALHEIATAASASRDLKTTLERSLAEVLAAMRCDGGAIHLLNETEGTLSVAVQQGTPAALLAPAEPETPVPALLNWVVAHAEPLVVPDVAADPRVPSATGVGDVHAYVGAPLRAGGKVLGVLSVVRRGRQQFSVEEVALLASIADQVGVTVENARLYEQARQAAVLEERQRLARELHDSVTQSLYSLTLLAEVGRTLAAEGRRECLQNCLAELGASAQQALKEMRLLVYELRPAVLETEGLISALQQRLDAVERRAGVETRLFVENTLEEMEAIVELPTPVEEELYRIAQEALNNALKHAAATSVAVYVRTTCRSVELEVVDNGRGFDLEHVRRTGGGMGLNNMRERAERLGGSLTILSAPGQGTKVRVTAALTPRPCRGGRVSASSFPAPSP